MSIDTVTTIAGSGAGSLAATVAAAAAGDTIVFAPYLAGGTITLAGTLDLNKSLTIEGHIGGGTGAASITLSGGTAVGDVVVDAGVQAVLDGLVIADGRSTGASAQFFAAGGPGAAAAGGILNNGSLTISHVDFVNDIGIGGYGGFGASAYPISTTTVARASGGGGPGGDAAGAIYDATGATLSLQAGTVTFSRDFGTGGHGAFGGPGSFASTAPFSDDGGFGGNGGSNGPGTAGTAGGPNNVHGGAGGAPGQQGSPGLAYTGTDTYGNPAPYYGPGGGGGGGTGFNTIGGTETTATTGALLHQVTITGNPLSFAGAIEAGPAGTQALADVGTLGFADGTLSYDAHSSAAAVSRLYGATLGRAPDAIGLGYFTDQLAHGISLTAVAATLAASPEFTAHYGAPDDPGFVGLLYQNVLGRAGDTVGTAYWTGQLAAGHSRAEVALGFSESAENVTHTAATAAAGIYVPDPLAVNVLRLDETLFDRGADGAGLLYWTAAQHAGASFDQVATAFAASPEFALHYGGLGHADYVAALYANVLGRPGDAAGTAFWTTELDGGTATQAMVAEGFATSAELTAKITPLVAHGITFT